MALKVAEVQASLEEDALDGWLLYDFQGSNPIARKLAGLSGTGKLTTRRWYYFIPAHGTPRALVHAIERHTLDHLPGEKLVYAERRQLEIGLEALLARARRVAMEYSPGCAIPYLARADAGTVELVRNGGREVVSSGDLVQRFEAAWDDQALESHCAASERLYRIKDRTFREIGRRMRDGVQTTEFEIQQLMSGWFREEGLVSDSDPVVAAQENAGNPHYLPAADQPRLIRADELVLLDLWGKLDRAGAVFADITWVGHTGSIVPDQQARAFAAACAGRDAAIRLVQDAVADGRELRGWEVDRAARETIAGRGFGPQFIHRTGHSLGETVHGNGVHLDDYETHDDRRLLAGAGFTVEPGVYFDTFGVRTEINMYVGAREAVVTGPVQHAIVILQT
jgi:Xaa-Pro dipeptidase